MSGTTPTFVGRLRRFTTLNVGQQLLLAVLSLVATPVLYHRLGETAYGVLALVNLLASQLAILEFGFGHATIRWVAQGRSRGDESAVLKTLNASLWVFMATAVVGGGVLLVGASPLVERFFNVPPDARASAATAVRVGSLFFVASVMGNLVSAVWQGLQRFGTLNLISGVASAVQILGSLALALAGFGVVAVVVWSTALGFLTLAVHAVVLARALPWKGSVRWPDAGTLKEMGRFGFLLMLAGALTQVVHSGGPLALGYFVTVGALPFFTVPLGLFQRLNRLAYGLAAALYPLVSELEGLRDDRTLERLFVSGTRSLLLLGIVAMAPAVLVASPFLTVWMGQEFAGGAGRALELLFVAFAFSLAAVPSIELARGTGRPGLLAAYTAVQAAVNLGAIALLATGWGATGAGVAFLAAQAASFVILGVKVGGRACGRVLTPSVLFLLMTGGSATLALLILTASPWTRLVAAAALGLVLAGAAARWVLSPEERSALLRMVARP
ncbi:MAG: oligosaccharide flippase family protein [Longimicrobiales bacterium]|nr:oligosaccharide flippase family protein [Longimicrobiales bacterium]